MTERLVLTAFVETGTRPEAVAPGTGLLQLRFFTNPLEVPTESDSLSFSTFIVHLLRDLVPAEAPQIDDVVARGDVAARPEARPRPTRLERPAKAARSPCRTGPELAQNPRDHGCELTAPERAVRILRGWLTEPEPTVNCSFVTSPTAALSPRSSTESERWTPQP